MQRVLGLRMICVDLNFMYRSLEFHNSMCRPPKIVLLTRLTLKIYKLFWDILKRKESFTV